MMRLQCTLTASALATSWPVPPTLTTWELMVATGLYDFENDLCLNLANSDAKQQYLTLDHCDQHSGLGQQFAIEGDADGQFGKLEEKFIIHVGSRSTSRVGHDTYSSDLCLDFADSEFVQFKECDASSPSQHFSYNPNGFPDYPAAIPALLPPNGKCLTADSMSAGSLVRISGCETGFIHLRKCTVEDPGFGILGGCGHPYEPERKAYTTPSPSVV